jgi:hypothetical protein
MIFLQKMAGGGYYNSNGSLGKAASEKIAQ